MKYQKILQVMISGFVLSSIPATVTLADQRTCRAVYDDCLRWCYGNRAGPDRHLCKRNCRAAFELVENDGVFHHQDGSREHCSRRLSVVDRPYLFGRPAMSDNISAFLFTIARPNW